MKILVHVKPNARANSIERTSDVTESFAHRFNVAVTASPEKGKANDATCKLIAQEFNIAPSLIEIVRGHTSRTKVVKINR